MAPTPPAPPADRASSSPAPTLTAEECSYADVPRPFKNPYYNRQGAPGKRNKSLKQILALERERADRLLEQRKQQVLAAIREERGEPPAADPMQVDGAAVEQQPAPVPNDPETERRLQEAFQQVISYSSVEAPPSLMPQKRYCDITGLEVRYLHPVDCSQMGKYRVGKEAKYTDPKSTLRYHNPEVYDILRTFQPAVIQAYLAVRGQGVVLR